MDILQSAYDPERFREQGHALIDMLADYLTDAQSSRPSQPVIPWRAPDEQYEHWKNFLASPGSPGDFFEKILNESIHLHQSRFMGHQVCPPAPLSALAGLMGGLLNNGMAVYEMGGPVTAIERLLIEKTAQILGFDARQAGGFLTSGGTLANLTALLAARSRYTGAHVWKDGHQKPLALMVSAEAHYCVDRAARIMGWGDAGIIKVPVNERFQMRTDQLETLYQHAMEQGMEVIAVVGSACSTSTGSFDDLAAIGRFCSRRNLWFHVDGAHGAALAFSRKHRSVLAGIETADSVALDYHKMLMTPALTTAVVFRQDADSYRTFSQQAQYLFGETEREWYNVAKRSFECTKLMMSIKVYSLLYTYGETLFENYVDQVMENGRIFAAMIALRPQWELAVEPQCNIVCFRHTPPGLSAESTDEHNLGIRRRILEDGRFYIVQTAIHGHTWLRVTLTNPFTSAVEMEELLGFCEGN
jgi:L-2,4-diaminobutyrate decarboxylase